MDLVKVLRNYGLEEKEAKVYLALLGLGEATATTLAEKTVLDRTLMYQITNKLAEKGIVSYVVKNNVRYFLATEPETLLKNLQEKEEELKQALPNLKSLQNKLIPKTNVEIYKGKEGINTILKMMIRDNKEYFIMGGATEACTLFELENIRFVKEAEKIKLRGKILARKNDDFFIGKYEEYRYVQDELISSTTMMIWGDKVAIFVWTEPYNVVLIRNVEITKSNITTFNYLWKQAEKPTKAEINKRLLKK